MKTRSQSLAMYLGCNVAVASTLLAHGFTAGAGDFIPSTDQGLYDFAANYSTKITAAPTDYGLVAGDATALAALVSDYNTKLTASTNPSTRTATTIADKDTSKDALVFKLRQLSRIVQASTATDDADRADLGLTIRDTDSTVSPVPSSKPVANVEDIQNVAHLLRLRDELTPTTNARPEGTIGAEVWYKIGPVAPASIADCQYASLATKRFITVEHDPANIGKLAFYLTRWINKSGERGPVSDIISATIAA